MTYLNDVEDGGETQWLYQGKLVKPKKGLTAIWPTDFTHTHRGVVSPTQRKTIVTGSFNCLNFEAAHSLLTKYDEDKINEAEKRQMKDEVNCQKLVTSIMRVRHLMNSQKYIDSTYDEHYSKNKFQATEFIIDGGHGEGFCIGNIMKYAQRYGKKNGGKNRSDLLKVIHYGIIALYINELEGEK